MKNPGKRKRMIRITVLTLLFSLCCGIAVPSKADALDDFWQAVDNWYQENIWDMQNPGLDLPPSQEPIPDDWQNEQTFEYQQEEEEEDDEKPALNRTSLDLGKKKRFTLKVKRAKGKVTWSSSNKKVATVSKSGVVKTKKAGKTTIKAKCSSPKCTLKCKVTVYSGTNPEGIRKKILAMKSKYKEGTKWTNSKFYYWKAINCNCYGCVAFVGIVSDKIFGKNKKVKRHCSFSKIKPGDHIRIGEYHSAIALSRNGNKITVAEGNFNSSIHWGRKISKSSLQKSGFYVETRY